MANYSRVFTHKKHVILFLYEYKCFICKHKSSSNHVHHIDQNKHNNDAFNLVPLCTECHILVHKATNVFAIRPPESLEKKLDILNRYF